MVDRKKQSHKRQRHRIELEGHLVNAEIHPVFISHRFYILQSNEEGEGKTLLYQDTKNKVIPSEYPKHKVTTP